MCEKFISMECYNITHSNFFKAIKWSRKTCFWVWNHDINDLILPKIVITRATLSVAAYARHIYFQLESAVWFEPHKVT